MIEDQFCKVAPINLKLKHRIKYAKELAIFSEIRLVPEVKGA